MTFPWEHELITTEPAPVTHADVVTAMQRDMAYMVTHTCVLVRSDNQALQMTINTPRGQIIPRGECRFTDGSKFEFQDIGMPQPGTPEMTVQELLARIWDVAHNLGLELAR